MSDRTGLLYADTSALVKLAVTEAETAAVREELAHWSGVVTSVLTEIELARAVARARERDAMALDEFAVWTITASLVEIELSATIRRAAAGLQPSAVRSLDAIHIATALSLGEDLGGVLTYDRRTPDALADRGVAVVAPTAG